VAVTESVDSKSYTLPQYWQLPATKKD